MFVTVVNRGKMGELMEIPFGLRTCVGPWKHVLDEGSDHPMGRGNFKGGKGRPVIKYSDLVIINRRRD